MMCILSFTPTIYSTSWSCFQSPIAAYICYWTGKCLHTSFQEWDSTRHTCSSFSENNKNWICTKKLSKTNTDTIVPLGGRGGRDSCDPWESLHEVLSESWVPEILAEWGLGGREWRDRLFSSELLKKEFVYKKDQH